MLTTIVQRTIRIKFSRRFLREHLSREMRGAEDEGGRRGGRGAEAWRGVNRFIAVLQRRNYCSVFPFRPIIYDPTGCERVRISAGGGEKGFCPSYLQVECFLSPSSVPPPSLSHPSLHPPLSRATYCAYAGGPP